MTRVAHLLLSVLAAAALPGCMGTTVEHPTSVALQGTWTRCTTDGTGDVGKQYVFSGDQLAWTVSRHSSIDGSCTGDATLVSETVGSFVIGGPLRAYVDGVEVVADGIDVKEGDRMFYTTVYIDVETTPETLYVGEPDPATGRDMTSGAKRPILLGESSSLLFSN